MSEFVARGYRFPLDRVHLMAILNVNDDSFCGDGSLDTAEVLERARRMVLDGADILDVGGESARTNRQPIPEAEEVRRVVPVIEAIRRELPEIPVSLNTWRPAVAQAGLAAGAAILNDMGGDPNGTHAALAAKYGAGLVIMHLRGEPKQPHTDATYGDVTREVIGYFRDRISAAKARGITGQSLLLDPGLDFAKQCEDNLRLLGRLDELASLGHALLLADSRKTFIGEILDKPVLERDWGTLAASLWAAEHGVKFLRVHNVAIHRDALAVWKAGRTGFDATVPAK